MKLRGEIVKNDTVKAETEIEVKVSPQKQQLIKVIRQMITTEGVVTTEQVIY